MGIFSELDALRQEWEETGEEQETARKEILDATIMDLITIGCTDDAEAVAKIALRRSPEVEDHEEEDGWGRFTAPQLQHGDELHDCQKEDGK